MKPLKAMIFKTFAPPVDGSGRRAKSSGNLFRGLAACRKQDDFRPRDKALGGLGGSTYCFESLPIDRFQLIDFVCACHDRHYNTP